LRLLSEKRWGVPFDRHLKVIGDQSGSAVCHWDDVIDWRMEACKVLARQLFRDLYRWISKATRTPRATTSGTLIRSGLRRLGLGARAVVVGDWLPSRVGRQDCGRRHPQKAQARCLNDSLVEFVIFMHIP
jgi:hypothetical protein